MSEVSMIGLDLAKNFIQAHGANTTGAVLFRKKLRRAELVPFLAAQAPCVVAMEACAGAHHVARAAAQLGHTARIAPAHYVKPFAKRGKSDRIDADAVIEAAQRPSMRFVPVKSIEQQAAASVFRTRDLIVRQRTMSINALRGQLAEYGLIAPKGLAHVGELVTLIAAAPEAARVCLRLLADNIAAFDAQIKRLDGEIARRAKADETARRLMTIPGCGPVFATAFLALAPAPQNFRRGRDFAAWVGLTPLPDGTGGKDRVGKTSKMGERTLRRLLMLGAASRVRQALRSGAAGDPWLARMLAEKPRMLVITALANRMARIAWAVAASGEVYRSSARGG